MRLASLAFDLIRLQPAKALDGSNWLRLCIYDRILASALRLGPSEERYESRRAGFDFAFATLIFDSPTLERPDDRQDYGEVRVIALGIADDIPLTVVYTDRAEVVARSFVESSRLE